MCRMCMDSLFGGLSLEINIEHWHQHLNRILLKVMRICECIDALINISS